VQVVDDIESLTSCTALDLRGHRWASEFYTLVINHNILQN